MISITKNQSTKVVGLANLRQPLTGSLKSGPNSAASKSFTYLQRQSLKVNHKGTNQLRSANRVGFRDAAGVEREGLRGVWDRIGQAVEMEIRVEVGGRVRHA